MKKRMEVLIAALVVFCLLVTASAETIEERAIAFVNLLNSAIEEAGNTYLYTNYQMEDEYNYTFGNDDNTLTLMLTGDENVFTGAAVLGYGVDRVDAAIISALGYFSAQSFLSEAVEAANWFTDINDDLKNAMDGGEQFMDGFVTESDVADVFVMTMDSSGTPMIEILVNIYPEGRTAYMTES